MSELEKSLLEAAKTLNLEAVQELLKKGADATYIEDPEGVWGSRAKNGPLHLALRKRPYKSDEDVRGGSSGLPREWGNLPEFGEPVAEELFLGHGADPNTVRLHEVHSMRTDGRSQVPILHEAVKEGQIAAVRTLLEHGAWVDAFSHQEFFNERGFNRHTEETALHLACDAGDLPMCALLLSKGAQVNTWRKRTEHVPSLTPSPTDDPRDARFVSSVLCVPIEETALHIALQQKNPELATLLVCSGADLTLPRRRDGKASSCQELCEGEERLAEALKATWSPETHHLFPSKAGEPRRARERENGSDDFSKAEMASARQRPLQGPKAPFQNLWGPGVRTYWRGDMGRDHPPTCSCFDPQRRRLQLAMASRDEERPMADAESPVYGRTIAVGHSGAWGPCAVGALMLCAAALGSVVTLKVQEIWSPTSRMIKKPGHEAGRGLVSETPSDPSNDPERKSGSTRCENTLRSSYGEAVAVRFFPSRASEVLGELSASEVEAVAGWFMQRTGTQPCRADPSIDQWLTGPSSVELLRPPKAETVAYLDGKGPKPARYARVTVATNSSVVEYKVGPITDLKNAQIEVLAFGMIWPQLAEHGGYVPNVGTVTTLPRNDPLAPAGTRRIRIKSAVVPPAPSRPDAQWLYPLPLDMEVNVTAWNVSEWSLNHITFCGQGPFDSPESDTPQKETPQARGARTVSGHNGVAWGAWSFSVTQRPSTGVAITDIRFRDERIVYELALMDAQAIYGGALRDQFMYSDSAYTLSQWSASLEPGVDCPSEATYLSATVVVRSIATVGNYDYIMDVKFRDDGEIHVETRFAGYPETRFPGKGEEAFSTLVRDGVAGIVHTHSVAWKADIEIAGSKNALHVTEVREHASEGLGVDWKADPKEPSFPTKILQHRYVEREGANSTFVADTHVPKAWAIVNRNSSVSRGSHKNPRGYRIELLSFATGQVHGASHPFVRAMPWTKYHLAVTKYQDNEYRPSSPYAPVAGPAYACPAGHHEPGRRAVGHLGDRGEGWQYSRHLVDRREIRVLGGHGGPGSCAYKRHAKHKMIGPGFPCGGSGGRGGDVIVEAGGSFFSLAHLDGHVEAGDGMAGKKGNLNGESGRNSKILVPRGTMVRELSGEEETEELADLNQLGDSIVVAKGGRGGMGNNMARPHESSEGQPGDDRRIELELKTVADVGLVGMPNAGKSTLLGSVSRAAPKIAPYPFTTVAPYVGKVDFVDGSSLSVADVPGLVEGAHRGEGLGHEFLRHLERTKVLMYVVDCARSPDPFGDYLSLQREAFSIMMAWKPSALVATKCDVKPEETLRKVDALYRSVRAAEESLGPAAPLFVRAISARFGEGISGLLQERRRAGSSALSFKGAMSDWPDGAISMPSLVHRPSSWGMKAGSFISESKNSFLDGLDLPETAEPEKLSKFTNAEVQAKQVDLLNVLMELIKPMAQKAEKATEERGPEVTRWLDPVASDM
eukprot:g31361.t1